MTIYAFYGDRSKVEKSKCIDPHVAPNNTAFLRVTRAIVGYINSNSDLDAAAGNFLLYTVRYAGSVRRIYAERD